MVYMVAYGLNLIFFTSVGTIIIINNPIFSNFVSAFETLFASSLGNFNFDLILDYKTVGGDTDYVGIIFYCIFLIINLILFLNLLIAMLNNIYASLSLKGLQL